MRPKRTLLLIIAFCALTACQKLVPDDVVGTYAYQTDKIQEILQVKPEGTYFQEIKSNGRTFTATGNWSVKGARTIVFRGVFLVRSELLTQKIIIPPIEFSYHTGILLSGGRIISFDAEENKYIVERMNGAVNIP